MLVRDVTILRPAAFTDRYGDSIPDPDSATSTEVLGWLSQTSATEPTGPGRALVTLTTEILFLPSGTDIEAHDRVEIDGQLYEVDGVPQSAWSPRGEHHIEANLRRVDG